MVSQTPPVVIPVSGSLFSVEDWKKWRKSTFVPSLFSLFSQVKEQLPHENYLMSRILCELDRKQALTNYWFFLSISTDVLKPNMKAGLASLSLTSSSVCHYACSGTFDVCTNLFGTNCNSRRSLFITYVSLKRIEY